MVSVVKWLYLVALIVWVGEVVFFSFVTAPGLFRAFPAPDAGRAVGAILPTYYLLGAVCGAVLLLTTVILAGSTTARLWWSLNALVVAVMLAATVYAGLGIQPRAAALRPQLHEPSAAPTVKEEFDRLHRQAVTLNSVVLLGGIVVTIITAASLRP